jgi:uncharacterized membrane protein HdeD (DUF308 family)
MDRLTNRFGDIQDIQQNWKWFLALGILLVALGAGVIGSSYYATIFSVVVLGFFLATAGVIQIAQAFLAKKWSGLFLSLGLGLIYLFAGATCITKPASAAIGITLWISAFFFIIGTFRMLTSLLLRFENWGWVFFNGLVTFLLGAMIYSDWPLSGLWVIGLFVGIDLILSGWSWIVLSLSARSKT